MKSLSNYQRISLINQFKILDHISSDSIYKQHIEVLRNGFTNFYDEIFETLSKEVPEEVSTFVHEVLNMYRSMHTFARRNNYPDLLEQMVFEGFDGATEFEYWDYTEFLLNFLNRYKELKDNKGDNDFNSHTSNIYQYKRQLKIWEKYNNPNFESINKDIISEILAA